MRSSPFRSAPCAGATCRPSAPACEERHSRDLDDVAARLPAAVAFADGRTAGRAFPADLAAELTYARETLAALSATTCKAARAKAFREEHDPESVQGVWFAVIDHAALLGLILA